MPSSAPLLAGIVLAALAGCAGVRVNVPGESDPRYMSKDEFRDYTQRVFRLHNRTANHVMMLLGELDGTEPDQFEGLSRLEADMMASCETLNRVVAARMQDRNGPGFLTLRSLPEQVAACHRATLAVRDAMP